MKIVIKVPKGIEIVTEEVDGTQADVKGAPTNPELAAKVGSEPQLDGKQAVEQEKLAERLTKVEADNKKKPVQQSPEEIKQKQDELKNAQLAEKEKQERLKRETEAAKKFQELQDKVVNLEKQAKPSSNPTQAAVDKTKEQIRDAAKPPAAKETEPADMKDVANIKNILEKLRAALK